MVEIVPQDREFAATEAKIRSRASDKPYVEGRQRMKPRCQSRSLFSGLLRTLAVPAALGFTQVSAAEDNSQTEAFRQGKTVALPPFIVSSEHGGGSHWQYASVNGLEILSRCGNIETEKFFDMFSDQDAILSEILPYSLRMKQAIPESMILVTPSIYRNMVSQMADVIKANVQWSVLPQLCRWDSESIGGIYVVSGDQDYSTTTISKDRVSEILARRKPSLPVWFSEGIKSIWEYSVLYDYGNVEEFNIKTVPWPKKKVRGSNVPVSLIPMKEFLSGPPDAKSEDFKFRANLWLTQGEIFLRWAFDDKSHTRREALWKVVDAASRGPVTEALFRQYFSMGYSDMDKELWNFIPREQEYPVTIARKVVSPSLPLRDATAVEVARIKGDFDVKEIEYVKENFPEYVDKYVGQASADLLGMYRKGARDPGFLATMGLFYASLWKDDQAKPLLESAVAAHVKRPSIYVQLARIRLTEALEKPTGDSGVGLGPEQVAAILMLLKESSQYSPAQAETYRLTMAVWNNTKVTPSADDVDFLGAGLVFFPNQRLADAVTRLRTLAKP